MLKTSAKSGQGVDEAFLEMTKALIKKQNSMSADERKKLGGPGMIGGKFGNQSLNKKKKEGEGSCAC